MPERIFPYTIMKIGAGGPFSSDDAHLYLAMQEQCGPGMMVL